MTHSVLDAAIVALPLFCFGYPFVMSWYWMAGGLLFYFERERFMPPHDHPVGMAQWPPISILIPCYNEGLHAEETLLTACASDYPDFEVIAINDGSSDNTAEVLDRLLATLPALRVIHMAANQGKAVALNTGAMLARHEIVVCIDGDALLDPHALRWIARAFRRGTVGGLAGNPRIRNRTTLLGRLQVGEFSSIVGLIRRTQTTWGRLFTVSGVICAFRRRALEDAGWWSPRTITDDIDISWRVQIAGWRVVFEPNAVAWILMPETLRGLWRQRLRWAEGGSQMLIDFFWPIARLRAPDLLPTYASSLLGVVWSYAMLISAVLALLRAGRILPLDLLPAFHFLPDWWGAALAVTYLCQAIVSHLVEHRYERGMLRMLFWIIWYPLVYWLISIATTVVALPRVLLNPRKANTTWISPDRGLR